MGVKLILLQFLLLTNGNILEGINENIIRPVQQAIFGEVNDSNSTIFIENSSIRNANRQVGSYFDKKNIKIDSFTNLEKIVVREQIGLLEITNNLPFIEIEEGFGVEEALFLQHQQCG